MGSNQGQPAVQAAGRAKALPCIPARAYRRQHSCSGRSPDLTR